MSIGGHAHWKDARLEEAFVDLLGTFEEPESCFGYYSHQEVAFITVLDPGAGQQHGGADDPMAYGDYHGPPRAHPEDPEDQDEGIEGERGIIGDTYGKFRGKYQSQ